MSRLIPQPPRPRPPNPGLIELSHVASNEALLSLIENVPAEDLKAALIEVIRVRGLTFNQRNIVSIVAELGGRLAITKVPKKEVG
jgi:hypothetical protein